MLFQFCLPVNRWRIICFMILQYSVLKLLEARCSVILKNYHVKLFVGYRFKSKSFNGYEIKISGDLLHLDGSVYQAPQLCNVFSSQVVSIPLPFMIFQASNSHMYLCRSSSIRMSIASLNDLVVAFVASSHALRIACLMKRYFLPGTCTVPYIEGIQYCSIEVRENWIWYLSISVLMNYS
ncbi:hypothetical protein SASPL_101817 [Salvia splendens]|uniref:Uncharacterized protein n=1 Tax=Salvia splendens TaxID=180675 RepID=A0A8X8YUP4_SALSN|nr:hypothetical protein SASPL_101817 [Salvia splendens]